MAGYRPTYIRANATGLIQSRENFLLPDDAYPTLENAFIWRERIKRKQGYQLLARLRRVFTMVTLGTADLAGDFTGNLKTIFTLQAGSEIQVSSVVVTDGVNTFTDNGLGVLVKSPVLPAGSGTINYTTGAITITGAVPSSTLTITFAYYPNLPVMGLLYRELNASNTQITVAFDTTYAYYLMGNQWAELTADGTTWSGGLPQANSNFFWGTNYWVDTANTKIFWVTNDSGTTGDPIRYTNAVGNGAGNWATFAPQIDIAGNKLQQCLALLPFRGRLVAFNTLEGMALVSATSFSNRIRWAAIGVPFTVDTGSPAVPTNSKAWRDDIRGQGGYLDIPTNEDIIAVGFVRDNLVIYCENSTWQLRYTGRTIAPFQIEKVNTELGTYSTFSAVQFDTSLVGVGNRGIVECDSVRSNLIDVKIPDLVMDHFNNLNQGNRRIYGIRDFYQRVAFWIYPEADNEGTFPDRRLVYNYENDSWAIFTDSLTCLGTIQPPGSRTWANSVFPWQNANFPWTNSQALILSIIGGNQQGFVEYLDEQTTSDPSLTITAITGNTTTPTVITSVNHNMQTGAVIKISNIPTGTPFSNLNAGIFGIEVNDANNFQLLLYDPRTDQFDLPQTDPPGVYIGGGLIAVRDNFSIVSKKFNFMEENQNVQLGYVDILMDTSDEPTAAITMNVYVNYNDNTATNQQPDTFFNTTIPLSASSLQTQDSTKTMQRVFCPTRGNYITIEYTFSNEQMNSVSQENDVQIDSQTVWMRPAGRIGSI